MSRLLLVLLVAGSAAADILITKEGRIVIGRIDPVRPSDTEITVRWPYGERLVRGSLKFVISREVRWYRIGSDVPDESYWKLHLDDDLIGDAVFSELKDETYSIYADRAARIAERLQSATTPAEPTTDPKTGEPVVMPDVIKTKSLELSSEVYQGKDKDRLGFWGYEIRVPRDWELVDRSNVRIHVFMPRGGIPSQKSPDLSREPEAKPFWPTIQVIFFETSPSPKLLGPTGLVTLGLKQTQDFADEWGQPSISEPVVSGDVSKCETEMHVRKGDRNLLVRKTFYICGNSAYIVASYDLESNLNRNDEVLRKALQSFTITRSRSSTDNR